MQKGNILIIFMIVLAIIIAIFTFVMVIFMSHVNSTLYSLKLDMYSIAKSGIIAVNKNKSNMGTLNYDSKAYKKYFEEALQENYNLNKQLANEDKLISKINIEEYKIYSKGQKDSYTKERCDDETLHILLKVNVRPIILRSFLEKIFVFEIHEDVNLNIVKE